MSSSFLSLLFLGLSFNSFVLSLRFAPEVDDGSAVGPLLINPDLDCAVRSLASEYSQYLLPWADPTLVFDALRLSIDCNATRPTQKSSSSSYSVAAFTLKPTTTGSVYYADAVNGNDNNAGTLASPFRTIAQGLAATRAAGGSSNQLILRSGGVFVIDKTIELSASDSGLTISAYPNDLPASPVISGGVSLAGLTWSPAPTPSPPPPPPPITPPVQGSILYYAAGNRECANFPGDGTPGVCAPLGQMPSAAACSAACLANVTCTGYTWHDSACGEYANWCYARLDNYSSSDGAANHYSGWKPSTPAPGKLNLWQATIPTSYGVGDINQLFLNDRRITRARYPNANPETDLSPKGYMDPKAWLPASSYPAPSEVHIPNVRPYDKWFPNFQWGFNGTVANFTSGSFWGTRNPPYGDQYSVPSGVTIQSAPFAGSWSRVTEGVVNSFQGGHWGGWSFKIGDGISADGLTIPFSEGGWQEARGGGGAALFIENIPELLDITGEWYFNKDTRVLTVAFNGTTPLDADTLVAAQLDELIRVTGTSSSPVNGVTLQGLVFKHTNVDYFLNFTVGGGGDWSFHNGGAVYLEGTVGTQILSCTFWSPGGNALMISGYNRMANITGNHFAYTGSNAIVSAGLYPGQIDAGAPEYPEGTVIEGNLMREIAIYVVQSGSYYAGLSANVTLRGNVVFNNARAGFNLNDPGFGGHLLTQNLLFNTVRITNDHGPVNSWDRIPYAWRSWNQSDVDPLPIQITRNFIVNNYNSVWSLCHDDGSNGYIDSFNFLPWSGTKDYLGFNKKSFNNYFLFSDYSPALVNGIITTPGVMRETAHGKPSLKHGWNACSMAYGSQALPFELRDVWANNTCICSTGSKFFSFNSCDAASPTDGGIPLFSSNTYASVDNTYSMTCGDKTWSLSEAQALGVDTGSSLVPVPTTAQIISAAHTLLQF